jgi:hypothetical protein
VSRAEGLKRRAEYHDMMKFVFTEVNRFVAPAFDQLRALGNKAHLTEVEALVPDYTPVVETEVQAWIETQPAYLQGAMNHVMQNGTSDEVADLIGRYRAANGVTPAAGTQAQAPAPTPAPAPAPAPATSKPPKTELSQAAKQAADSLAPVGGDRSQVPADESTQDFGSAFDRYAKMG